MGSPSKEKSSAELPTINKTDTRKELAKLAGVGERTYGKAVAILHSDNKDVKQKEFHGNQHTGGLNSISDKVQSEPIHTTDELAKLAGGKNSLTLPKSDKSINKVHTTDELAKLANDGGL